MLIRQSVKVLSSSIRTHCGQQHCGTDAHTVARRGRQDRWATGNEQRSRPASLRYAQAPAASSTALWSTNSSMFSCRKAAAVPVSRPDLSSTASGSTPSCGRWCLHHTTKALDRQGHTTSPQSTHVPADPGNCSPHSNITRHNFTGFD